MSGEFMSWEAAVEWLRGQPDRQGLVEECYYDGTPTEAAARYWRSAEWVAARDLLPPSTGRALDLGAGRGIASYALAKDGWHVVAVEPDASDLVGRGAINRISRSENLGIEVFEGFAEGIPCEAESFDLVFARQALHHANDLSAFCREVHRVLKPGGRFVTLREHVISAPQDLPDFLAGHPLHDLYGGENAYLARQYLSALRGAGLRVDRLLRSFDSAVNYAPHSLASLRMEIHRRLSMRLPQAVARVAGLLLPGDVFMRALLPFLSLLDSRPGRLYSFVCTRPAKSE